VAAPAGAAAAAPKGDTEAGVAVGVGETLAHAASSKTLAGAASLRINAKGSDDIATLT
jgi:hypothetical protein